MKKRILSLLIVLCLLAGTIPAANAEVIASGTCGDNLTWRYEETFNPVMFYVVSNLYVEGEGDMYDYELDGNGDSTAPWGGKDYYGLTIGSNVTSIGNYAFYDYGTSSVLDLLETDLTRIGRYAFANTYVKKVFLPKGLTSIEDGLFSGDLNLTSVYIPDGVTSIGNLAFESTIVESLVIPETVNTIGSRAFAGIPGPIYFSGDVPAFTAETESGNTGTFAHYGGIIYYPADDPAWEEAAAKNNYGSYTWSPYTSPSGICGNNLTWRLENNTLYIEGEGDMYDYDNDISNPAPWSELSFYNLVIGADVTSIGNEAFFYCQNLMQTNLGESNVKRIGQFAFYNSGIRHADVPYGVTALEKSVFASTSLASVSLPDSLVSIGDTVFFRSGAPEIVIPSSVKTMGNGVFGAATADVRFLGDAPEYVPEDGETDGTFGWLTGTIYYPGNNPTWTNIVATELGAWYKWVPYYQNPFTDVPADSFYYEPVLWALENNITTGATPDTFNPNGECLRAQVVTFLHRAAENPEPTSSSNPFTDVKSTDFFYKPVLWAVEKSITNGVSANKFGSYDVCNRAAVVTFLWRAAGSPEPESTVNPFTDVKPTDFFYKPVLWAVENGITNGLSATEFGPASACNRAQVVTFLYRAWN